MIDFDKDYNYSSDSDDDSAFYAKHSQIEACPKAKQQKLYKAVLSFVPFTVQARFLHQSELLKSPEKDHFYASILMCDIKGFTSLCANEKDPSIVSSMLNSMFSTVINVVFKYSGDIINFAGDALICLFSQFKRDNNSDAQLDAPQQLLQQRCNNEVPLCTQRSIQCALALRDVLKREHGRTRLRLHIGVGSGPSFSLHIGGVENQWVYLVGGMAFDGLAQAIKDAKEGQICVTPKAWKDIEKHCEGQVLSTGSARVDRGRFPLSGPSLIDSMGSTGSNSSLLNIPNPVSKELGSSLLVPGGERALRPSSTRSSRTSGHLRVNGGSTGGNGDRTHGRHPSQTQLSLGSNGSNSAANGDKDKDREDDRLNSARSSSHSSQSSNENGPHIASRLLKICINAESGPNADKLRSKNPMHVIRSYVQKDILDRLETGHLIWGEQRSVTVVFVRLDRMTLHQSDCDVITTHQILRSVQTVLLKLDGLLRQFLVDDKGTVLIGLFGAVKSHPDDPCRGVKAALEIQRELTRLHQGTSIGVTSGRVWCGSVGSRQRQEFVAVGAVVNKSARLMVAANGSILCDDTTKERCASVVHFEPTTCKEGRAHRPIKVNPRVNQVRVDLSELIGLDEEVRQLDGALERLVKQGTGSILFLEGEAGFGKSKLARYIAKKAQKQGVSVLCSNDDLSSAQCGTLSAWRDIAMQFMQMRGADGPSRLSQPLAQKRSVSAVAGSGGFASMQPPDSSLPRSETVLGNVSYSSVDHNGLPPVSQTSRSQYPSAEGSNSLSASNRKNSFSTPCFASLTVPSTSPSASPRGTLHTAAAMGRHALAPLAIPTQSVETQYSQMRITSDSPSPTPTPTAPSGPPPPVEDPFSSDINVNGGLPIYRKSVSSDPFSSQTPHNSSAPSRPRMRGPSSVAHSHVDPSSGRLVTPLEFSRLLRLSKSPAILRANHPATNPTSPLSRRSETVSFASQSSPAVSPHTHPQAPIELDAPITMQDLTPDGRAPQLMSSTHLHPSSSLRSLSNGTVSTGPGSTPSSTATADSAIYPDQPRAPGASSYPSWPAIIPREWSEDESVRTRCRTVLNMYGPLLNAALGTALPENANTRMLTGPDRVKKTAAVFSYLIQSVAYAGPTMLIIHDVHFIDPLSLQVALNVAQSVYPLLVIFTHRPFGSEFPQPPGIDRLMESADARSLSIRPLSILDGGALAARFLGVQSITQEVADLLHARTSGNPFFIQELALMLLDSGLLSVEDGVASLSQRQGELVSADLPEAVESLLMSRIDRLPPAHQTTLKAAAVIGPRFTHSLLMAIYPIGDGVTRLPLMLRDLCRMQLVEEVPNQHGSYSFKSAMIRDVCYNLMPPAYLHSLHLSMARAMEQRQSVSRGLLSPGQHPYALIAFHLDHALRNASKIMDKETILKCIFFHCKAAHASFVNATYPEALNLYNTAIPHIAKLSDGPDRERLEMALLARRIPLLQYVHGLNDPRILTDILRVKELYERMYDRVQARCAASHERMPTLVVLCRLKWQWLHALTLSAMGQRLEAHKAATKMLFWAKAISSPLLILHARYAIGCQAMLTGALHRSLPQFAQALKDNETILKHADSGYGNSVSLASNSSFLGLGGSSSSLSSSASMMSACGSSNSLGPSTSTTTAAAAGGGGPGSDPALDYDDDVLLEFFSHPLPCETQQNLIAGQPALMKLDPALPLKSCSHAFPFMKMAPKAALFSFNALSHALLSRVGESWHLLMQGISHAEQATATDKSDVSSLTGTYLVASFISILLRNLKAVEVLVSQLGVMAAENGLTEMLSAAHAIQGWLSAHQNPKCALTYYPRDPDTLADCSSGPESVSAAGTRSRSGSGSQSNSGSTDDTDSLAHTRREWETLLRSSSFNTMAPSSSRAQRRVITFTSDTLATTTAAFPSSPTHRYTVTEPEESTAANTVASPTAQYPPRKDSTSSGGEGLTVAMAHPHSLKQRQIRAGTLPSLQLCGLGAGGGKYTLTAFSVPSTRTPSIKRSESVLSQLSQAASERSAGGVSSDEHRGSAVTQTPATRTGPHRVRTEQEGWVLRDPARLVASALEFLDSLPYACFFHLIYVQTLLASGKAKLCEEKCKELTESESARERLGVCVAAVIHIRAKAVLEQDPRLLRAAEVEQLLQECIAAAQSTQAAVFESEALLTLAQVYHRLNRPTDQILQVLDTTIDRCALESRPSGPGRTSRPSSNSSSSSTPSRQLGSASLPSSPLHSRRPSLGTSGAAGTAATTASTTTTTTTATSGGGSGAKGRRASVARRLSLAVAVSGADSPSENERECDQAGAPPPQPKPHRRRSISLQQQQQQSRKAAQRRDSLALGVTVADSLAPPAGKTSGIGGAQLLPMRKVKSYNGGREMEGVGLSPVPEREFHAHRSNEVGKKRGSAPLLVRANSIEEGTRWDPPRSGEATPTAHSTLMNTAGSDSVGTLPSTSVELVKAFIEETPQTKIYERPPAIGSLKRSVSATSHCHSHPYPARARGSGSALARAPHPDKVHTGPIRWPLLQEAELFKEKVQTMALLRSEN